MHSLLSRSECKFACYMWEGYRRHTGPELRQGSVARVSKQRAHSVGSAAAAAVTLRRHRAAVHLPGKARSAVIGLLWTNRAVGFVVVFMCAPQPQPQPQP